MKLAMQFNELIKKSQELQKERVPAPHLFPAALSTPARPTCRPHPEHPTMSRSALAGQTISRPWMQDGYKQAQVETQMAAEEAEGEQRSDAMPTKCNGNFNVNDMLAGNIKASDYFMSLMEFQTFEDVVDEIYNRVTAAGPWAAGSARLPSTLFCIVYKLFIMKLTYKQVTALLTHPDSPYIRCAGFLYLRYVCVPAQLWNWFESFLLDEESFSPSGNPDSTTTIGSWCHGLLTDLKYVRGYVCGGVPCLCARVGGSRTRKTRNDSACVCESSCTC